AGPDGGDEHGTAVDGRRPYLSVVDGRTVLLPGSLAALIALLPDDGPPLPEHGPTLGDAGQTAPAGVDAPDSGAVAGASDSAAHPAPGGPAARRSAPGACPAGRPAPAARRRVPGHRRPVRPRGRGAAPARRRHRAPGPRRHLRPARARRQWTAHRLRLLAEVSAAHRGSSSIRWWSSARLRITVGITVLSAVVFATMVVFVLHLLALSSDRSADTRLNREAADFSTFMNAGVLPSFEAESPTAEDLIRAYLSQQYPSDQLLLVG